MEGLRYLWDRPGRRDFLLAAAGINFLAMPVIILLPFYVADRLGQGAMWYGFLLASLGAGSLAGYLWVGLLDVGSDLRPRLVTAAFCSVGILLATIGMQREPVVALGLVFVLGVCTGVINVLVLTLFQISTPTDVRGRVMALVITMSGALTPFGLLLGGVLGDATGRNVPIVFLVCGALILVIAALTLARPRCRAFLGWRVHGEPEATAERVVSGRSAGR